MDNDIRNDYNDEGTEFTYEEKKEGSDYYKNNLGISSDVMYLWG